ncbi:hypothetical protein A4A49_61683, partial [Nicotiana attenuata]
TRKRQIEFLKFDGTELRDWVSKSEQYFDVDNTSENSKVKLASLHLEGKALQWHQGYMKNRITREWPTWGEYVRALFGRFGTVLYDDPMGDLKDLKQISSMQDYVDIFDELLTRVELSEEYIVSMHAMTGLMDYRTMKLTGSVGAKAVHILIDTGSTHNFLDLNTAKRLGCALQAMPSFAVAVANGNMVYSKYMCKGFSSRMQGVDFAANMLILPLGGCSVVLGIQWLITLGDIRWNFRQLNMEFMMQGKKVS